MNVKKLPGFNSTVTVFCKSVDSDTKPIKNKWEKVVLKNCFYGTSSSVADSNGIKRRNYSTVCKIPYPVKEKPDLLINTGDLVFLGNISDDITGKEPFCENDIRKKYPGSSFIVKEVAYLTTTGILPHILVSEV